MMIASMVPVYPRVCGGTSLRKVGLVGKPGLSPRVRGGTFPFCPSWAFNAGLSPRVRGNPSLSLLSPVSLRSIPACAGEPGAGPRGFTGFSVYPRVCGGTLGRASGTVVQDGLSPRVRGNPTCRLPSGRYERSIPACAGEPVVLDFPVKLVAVYPPRVRGNPNDKPYAREILGVYPRVCGGTRPGSDACWST